MLFLLLACAATRAPDTASPGADTAHPDTDSGVDSATDSGADSDVDSGADSGADSGSDSGADTATDPVYDGLPCATYGDAVAIGTVQDPALNELSGLVVSRLNPGVLWTHEDSGGAAALYALDADGRTVATLVVEGVENDDWEDLAIGPCGEGWCLAIGDIGTRGTSRSEFAVIVVEEPLLDGTPTLSAVPEIRPFTYPAGAEDAESLALAPDGTPIVISKREDATAGVYQLPAGASVLEWLGDIVTGAPDEDLTARATAADLWPDQSRLLLRTYFHLYELDSADLRALSTPRPVTFALELQGEAVAYDPVQGGFWQVSEGVGPTLFHTPCGS